VWCLLVLLAGRLANVLSYSCRHAVCRMMLSALHYCWQVSHPCQHVLLCLPMACCGIGSMFLWILHLLKWTLQIFVVNCQCHWSTLEWETLWYFSNNNNNNNYNNSNNNHDNIYSAVIIAEPLQEFTRFTRWIQKRCQVSADLWTKPTNLSRRPACIGSQ